MKRISFLIRADRLAFRVAARVSARTSRGARAGWVVVAGVAGVLAAQEPPLPREVVILSSAVQADIASGILDPVRQSLSLPLQYLGLTVRAQRIGADRPPPVDPRRVRGIVTLLRRTEVLPPWVWPWLQDQARAPGAAGLRFIHLGSLQPLARTVAPEQRGQLRTWLKAFGLRYDDAIVDDPLRIEVVADARSAFEQPPGGRRLHCGPASERGSHRVWLTTRLRGDGAASGAEADTRHPVVVGSFGAVALDPYLYRPRRGTESFRWILDPFRFFSEALGWEGIPAPAPAVAFGRRIRLLQIDGVGFHQPSSVMAESTCGAVLEERLIRGLREPVTVGFTAADLKQSGLEAVRRWAAHPFVEVASCGRRGPSNWRVPAGAPRSDAEFAQEMAREVTEGSAQLRRALGVKPVRLFLWSGYANPLPGAVEAAEMSGLCHANGGGFRLQPGARSVGLVSPWGWRVDNHHQVFLGAGGGAWYPGTYGDMPMMFARVDETLAATGEPRILKPAHLRVDFRIASSAMPLHVLRARLERWGTGGGLVPLPVSHYVRAVRAALDDFAVHPRPQGWRFGGIGGTCTVRCPTEIRSIDWARSPGVVGARHLHGALHLLLAGATAEVTWTSSPRPRPHLVEADHLLRSIRRTRKGLELVSVAHRPRRLVFGGFPPFARLGWTVDGASRRGTADEEGRFVIELDRSGSLDLRLELRTP